MKNCLKMFNLITNNLINQTLKQSIKNRLYVMFHLEDTTDRLSLYFDIFLISIISLNILFLIIESVEWIYLRYQTFFNVFELISVIIFTIEYLLRVWTITEDPRFAHPLKGRIKYIFKPIAIVDLIAFVPFYIPFIAGDMRFLRMLRIVRLIRIFKIVHYFKPLVIIFNVFRRKSKELLMSLAFLLFMLVFVSSIMYFVEHEAQPEAFSSIPQTMWWGTAALTTVGYGDIYPITTLGKIIGGFISILGIGFFALPAGILASGFSAELRSNKKQGEGNP
jgi:voltage-gated potassium channel